MATTNKIVTSTILGYYDTKLKTWINTEISTGISKLGSVLKLAGRVDDTASLPSSDVEVGTVYLVGAEGSPEFEEYYYYDGKWEYMGVTRTSLDGYINDKMLYKGEDGTGTPTAPASGTILAPIVALINANKTSIDEINNESTGILATSKSYTDTEIGKVTPRVDDLEETVGTLATTADIDALFT